MNTQSPSYAVRQLAGSAGFYVLVTWPDGFETQVHGFTCESEVEAWISQTGPRWREWAPQRAQYEPNWEDSCSSGANPSRTMPNLLNQLENAREQMKYRQEHVRLLQEYLAVLARINVNTSAQRNELAILQRELERWKSLHCRVAELIMRVSRTDLGS